MKKSKHFIPSIIFSLYILLLSSVLLVTACSSVAVLSAPKPAPELELAPSPPPIADTAPPSPPATIAPMPEQMTESKTEPKYLLLVEGRSYLQYKYQNESEALTEKPKPTDKTTTSKSPKDENIERYKGYKAVLGADPTIITPGPPGRLKVWIGNPNYKPTFSNGMTQASGTFQALGAAAKITPFAPAFKVEPKESACIQIDPSGSEIGFALTPLKDEDGTFEVGAHVQMYGSIDCSGTQIPKATTTLQVQVIVKHAKKFCEVFWEQLLRFWGELLLLLSALILFLIRKQLKKLIGFGNDN